EEGLVPGDADAGQFLEQERLEYSPAARGRDFHSQRQLARNGQDEQGCPRFDCRRGRSRIPASLPGSGPPEMRCRPAGLGLRRTHCWADTRVPNRAAWLRALVICSRRAEAAFITITLAGATGYVLNNPQEWQWSDLFWQLTLLQAWGVTPSPGWNAPA